MVLTQALQIPRKPEEVVGKDVGMDLDVDVENVDCRGAGMGHMRYNELGKTSSPEVLGEAEVMSGRFGSRRDVLTYDRPSNKPHSSAVRAYTSYADLCVHESLRLTVWCICPLPDRLAG